MPRCRPEAGPQEKASVGVPRVAIETGKVLRTAVAARPRVGSQARSKARDSRSLPEGVPRFESWPTHRIRPVPRLGCTETHPAPACMTQVETLVAPDLTHGRGAETAFHLEWHQSDVKIKS